MTTTIHTKGETMMTRKEAKVATIDQLTDELAAAGWDSTQQSRAAALEAVLLLIEETEAAELRLLAAKVTVLGGGTWPINPSGRPACDRCDRDATRVSYSNPSPDGACFFCDRCDEHDNI